jgi:hypothetical protein
VGLGVGGGYDVLESGSQSVTNTGTDSSFEQIQGRVSWRPARKLSVSASGGVQIQQFLIDDGGKTVVNPIYSLSAGWSPTETTGISVGASRVVGNSILSDQYTDATSVGVEFSQRLFRRLRLSISPTLNLTRYHSNTDPTGRADRTDDIRAIHASLSTVLLRRVHTTIFFSFTDNDSDDPDYAFETRQYGFQLSYRF